MNLRRTVHKPIRARLFLFVHSPLPFYLFYYPHVSYRYMDHLLDTETYRVEVCNEPELEMGEEQREELLGLMRGLKYGFTYGGHALLQRDALVLRQERPCPFCHIAHLKGERWCGIL